MSTPWWSLPSGSERQAAKLADETNGPRIRELRRGRQAVRKYHWLDEHTRFFIGADRQYEFPQGDIDKKRAAREAARQSYDRILETL